MVYSPQSQASTSELYGKVVETPQTEKTPFYPRSPYGVAKLYAFWIVKNYRQFFALASHSYASDALRNPQASLTTCTHATVSCSTTSRPVVAALSLPARFRALLPRSRSASKTAW